MSTINSDEQKLYDKWERWIREAEHDKQKNPKHPDVIIYDGLCGTGKTTSVYSLINAINNLSEAHNNRAFEDDEINIKPIPTFIFVAPTLMECHRVAGSIPVDIPLEYTDVYAGFELSDMPENDGKINKEQRRDENGNVIYLEQKPTDRNFIIPPLPSTKTDANSFRTRLDSVKSAVRLNQDIAIPHASFIYFDQELIDLIAQRNYHLIIDEVPNVFGKVTDLIDKDVSKNDIENFINEGNLKIDEDGIVEWVATEIVKKWDTFRSLKKYMDEERIVHYSHKGSVFFQRSNPKLYKCCKSIRILTYIFEGSICKSYFELYNISYTTRHFIKELDNTLKYRDLIELANSNNKELKALGVTDLSSSWFRKTKHDDLKFLRDATQSFFKNKCKDSTANQKLWTCYKKDIKKCEEKGYLNRWLYITARGTNLYRHVNSMAYLVNRFPDSHLYNFFSTKAKELKNEEIKINADRYALGELLQWVFRSQIRDEKPIILFLPSIRMKQLLLGWFDEIDGVEHNITEAVPVKKRKRKYLGN